MKVFLSLFFCFACSEISSNKWFARSISKFCFAPQIFQVPGVAPQFFRASYASVFISNFVYYWTQFKLNDKNMRLRAELNFISISNHNKKQKQHTLILPFVSRLHFGPFWLLDSFWWASLHLHVSNLDTSIHVSKLSAYFNQFNSKCESWFILFFRFCCIQEHYNNSIFVVRSKEYLCVTIHTHSNFLSLI